MPRAWGWFRHISHHRIVTPDWLSVARQPWLCRARFGSGVCGLAAHEREGDAREFVGERDGNKLEGLGLHQLAGPEPACVGMALAMIKYGMRADDEQLTQVAIAHLRQASKPFLSSRRVLARRQAEPGRKLARTREAGDIRHTGSDGAGRHGANAGYARQAARDGVRLGQGLTLGRGLSETDRSIAPC
jgi:hypothetical protein